MNKTYVVKRYVEDGFEALKENAVEGSFSSKKQAQDFIQKLELETSNIGSQFFIEEQDISR